MHKYKFCILSLFITFLASAQSDGPVRSMPGEFPYESEYSPDLYTRRVNHVLEFPRNGVINADGKTNKRLFSGNVKNKKLDGGWMSWYDNGVVLDSGHFESGIPDGEWKHRDSSGQLLAIRNYSADKFRRVKNEIKANHPRNFFFPLTALYKKDPAAAKWHLTAAHSFLFTDGRSTIRTIDEYVEQNMLSPKDYRPLFNESLQHGLYINYFRNGLVKDSGYYKDGLKDGVWLHRNSEAGSSFVGAYKNGMRQYEWKQYDASGKLTTLVFYTSTGKEEGRKIIRK